MSVVVYMICEMVHGPRSLRSIKGPPDCRHRAWMRHRVRRGDAVVLIVVCAHGLHVRGLS